MLRLGLAAALALLGVAAAGAPAAEADGFREDARSIERLVNDHYAYPERFEGGAMPLSPKLRAEAAAVADKRALLHYAERALAALADHHAITGSSFADSWGLVPSQTDLWVERSGSDYRIGAVRAGSPAEAAGIVPGDRLASIDGVATAEAVRDFWEELGFTGPVSAERAGYAARVLAAGRRNRARRLAVATGERVRSLELAHFASLPRPDGPPVVLGEEDGAATLRFADSLGDEATIAAFDAAMARVAGRKRIVIDLTDTPSGGNTVVARAILGWFVDRPTAYQIHSDPSEERRTGIGRRWIEQVLPRAGKRYRGRVALRVGRWTGSMGEGLAIAFDALGARVRGDRMAGLLGAIDDYRLEHSGLVIKFPSERLMAVDGTPRELFVPKPLPRRQR